MTEITFREHFTRDTFPYWPCPSCSEGTLLLEVKSLIDIETAASARESFEEHWLPDQTKGRFFATFRCRNCHDPVLCSGNTGVERDDGSGDYFSYYSPKYFLPAIPIINSKFNLALPRCVQILLDNAFELYWCDLDACANRMRATLEAVLDEMKIPRRVRDDVAKELSLHQRIDRMMDQVPGEVGRMILALKWLGNAGSHELKGIDRKEILKGFQFFEYCLTKLFPSTVENGAQLLIHAEEIILKFGAIRK